MNDPIADRVATLIHDLFGLPPTVLTSAVTLTDGLQLDSLSIMELQVVIEDTFDIDLSRPDTADLDPDGVRTYGDLVTVVRSAVQRRRQAS